jgi:membrane protein required for beta-lactamase induction
MLAGADLLRRCEDLRHGGEERALREAVVHHAAVLVREVRKDARAYADAEHNDDEHETDQAAEEALFGVDVGEFELDRHPQ